MPQFGIKDVIAKIDTGAFSGAMHCSLIEEYTRPSDGKNILRFIPSDNQANVTEVEDYEVIQVRSSTGHEVRRYLVGTEMIIKDTRYTITIGLSDRSKMQREILIGRRFLRENNILVDTRIHQELDNDGGDKQYENSDSI